MNPTFHRFAIGFREFLGLTPAASLNQANNAVSLTQFMDIHRRVRMYLRALWDIDFVMKQTNLALDDAENQPFIEKNAHIHLPYAFYDFTADGARPVAGLEVYRAAAAHASAHIMYTNHHFSARSLDKWQIAMISVIEDARVETLAIRKFSGLKYLWAMQHKASPLDNKSAGDYLNRLARALLDETYLDDDPWINRGRELFKSAGNLEDHHISRTVGLSLADSFREKKIRFHARPDMVRVSYRDNNHFLWGRPGQPLEIINPYLRSKTDFMANDSGEDFKDSRVPSKAAEDDQEVLGTYFYPEWNYRSQTSDQSWVTLREMRPETGDLKIIDDILAEHRHLLSRTKALLHAIRDGTVRRVRKLEEGDEIDINAAIRAQTDIRLGRQPDPRIMMRLARKTRDISVLMLLDLSNSMNNIIPGREQTALQLIQQVSALFADAIEAVGDPFAIHGFSSESRHNVGYFRLKDFEQPYDEVQKAKLAGITGHLGTRMGAAIRHATYHLNNQKSGKKLLILLSDGEPTDIDVPDKKYLRDDTKKSVEEAMSSGIHTYCISLDPGADKYVSRIFGAKNYMVVDHIKHLPEKILLLYAALTR